MNEIDQVCLYCKRDNNQVPLITLTYQGQAKFICAQHLPILFHEPGKLAGILHGAENLQPSEVHDHD